MSDVQHRHRFGSLPLPLFWALLAALSILGVFVLPFAFPPPTPSFSASYTIGFNNRVAAVMTALLSLAATAFLWRRSRFGAYPETQPATQTGLPASWLALACAVAVIYTAFFGARVAHADLYFSDASYFLNQLTGHAHQLPYRDFEFAYGPLLFYWPRLFFLVMGGAGLGPAAAYMVALATMQVLGLAVAFYLLGRLPLSRAVQGIALATLTFGTLTPLLGLNYTLFRFLLPYAALFCIARRSTIRTQAVGFALAELLMLAVSVEVGIAFAGGVILYALYRATQTRAWALLALVPPAAFLLFAMVIGKSYFRTMTHFALGAFNSPVEPLPHILIYLVAAIALSPLAVAASLRRPLHNLTAPLVGMYGVALGMVPSALGHCDGLHVFFSGLGFLLLSLVAVRAFAGPWPKLWLALFVALTAYSQVGQAVFFLPVIRSAFSSTPGDTAGINIARLQALTHGARIAAPASLPPAVERRLIHDGQFEPTYFSFFINAWDEESERRKLTDLQRASFLLLPASWPPEVSLPNNSRLHRLLRLGYAYPVRRPPYVLGSLIAADIRQHWTPVASLGQYRLYRQR